MPVQQTVAVKSSDVDQLTVWSVASAGSIVALNVVVKPFITVVSPVMVMFVTSTASWVICMEKLSVILRNPEKRKIQAMLLKKIAYIPPLNTAGYTLCFT